MQESVKFSSKMDREVLEDLRTHAARSGRTLASVLTEASREYLMRAQVRPPVKEAIDQVLDDHAELLQRLAR